jgi:hypothetical protein
LQKNKGNKTIDNTSTAMNKTVFAWALLFVFLFFALSKFNLVDFAVGNPDESFPSLAMPTEQVNYTIASINGTLWAEIDGDYPISILSSSGCIFSGDLPMVYPMPPGAANIHVFLDGQELSWTNYTQDYPDALHHTAIGDWGMIYCVLSGVSDTFELKIHYEHPLQMINGSYLLLYDLNISPYLSEQSNNSTCYYTIRMETNTTILHAYTTATDSQWNPINFTNTQEGANTIISVAEHSVYNQPLPGDFVVEFNVVDQVPDFPLWILPIILMAIMSAGISYLMKGRFLRKVLARMLC